MGIDVLTVWHDLSQIRMVNYMDNLAPSWRGGRRGCRVRGLRGCLCGYSSRGRRPASIRGALLGEDGTCL
ncbi:hypothetical protein [Streptomyces sp. NPDC059446]|uniref:hypothetical protein n=1 Tax=Streptomyces sp. NPDC059446 TaxID=3346833 RepID=UPI0036AD8895